MSEQKPSVFVHLLPALIAPGALSGGVAVVIDVLRATTVMARALASGCEAVIPCLEVEEAKLAAASLPPGTALLAGERRGLPIPGFDLGNSPDDFTPERCAGKVLVTTTTNGTRALLACAGADEVAVGALVNEDAVAAWAARSGRPVHVVCAGTEGEVSLEDTLLAGALANNLSGRGFIPGNDPARVSAALHRAALDEESSGLVTWPGWLSRGRGGSRVVEIGLARDVEASARWNSTPVVPVLRPGRPPRLVLHRDG